MRALHPPLERSLVAAGRRSSSGGGGARTSSYIMCNKLVITSASLGLWPPCLSRWDPSPGACVVRRRCARPSTKRDVLLGMALVSHDQLQLDTLFLLTFGERLGLVRCDVGGCPLVNRLSRALTWPPSLRQVEPGCETDFCEQLRGTRVRCSSSFPSPELINPSHSAGAACRGVGAAARRCTDTRRE